MQQLLETGTSPKAWYRNACEQSGFVFDTRQTAAIEELETLWHQLVEFKARRNQFLGRSLLSPAVPKGLYIWGGVGRGKTFLMDGFYHCLPYRRKRRIHFHNFMLEVHQEMKRHAHERDPLMAVAAKIERSTRLLCLDEFHVDDIADAMILGRLLAALLERGVVLLTTSNYSPDALYPNGLQRQNFLPAIALLKRELKVLHLDSDTDYRMLHMARDPLFTLATDAKAEERMGAFFRRLTADMHAETEAIQVKQIRIPVRRVAREVVWFDFKVLCGGHHDQSDYLEIAHRYPTVFVSGIPRMTAENAPEARRFAWLIDVLYDNHVKLVASFEVEPGMLYEDGRHDSESQRITSRLAEMQTHRYLELPHHSRGVALG
ncbi:cell division protein ZapE [Sideroxyarcus emersonii]|uniref:Cell division protein ZapE n=1 Tax=Sideroxyarcus emersonii TaxID=2764705 RepID=A0AAN1X9X6_9PROT|nr:cell division protein ZapE [Sideroxyarcus emersonii]BCK87478.1 cell division protein ZapE [Sideroxyarcus emersonii]